MKALILGAIAFFAGAGAGAACAQSSWQAVELKDLRGTADFHYRSEQNAFLATEGDFDGDGHADKARLLRNEKDRKFALEIMLANGKSQHLVEGDITEMPRLAVTVVSAGLYSTSCVKGPAAGACSPTDITLKNDAISLFQFNGLNRYFYWTGGHFESAYMVD